jgi:DDE superfamily endonuclease
MAGLLAYRPGRRGHLFYRLRIHRGRKNERRSLSEDDYAALVTAAHHQLHAPIILCWDNVNTHVSTVMRAFTAAHGDWLTVVQLPAYAPDLNPVEGVWSVVKNGLGNLAAHGLDHLAAIIRNRLKRIQYRPQLYHGFLTQTGLLFPAQPP